MRVEEEEEPPSRPMSPTEQFNLMTYIERMEVGPLACERDFEVNTHCTEDTINTECTKEASVGRLLVRQTLNRGGSCSNPLCYSFEV